jgi:hypothetical protein
VYCANNPIKLIDPDGRKIVDANGKRITYTVNADGTLTWSKNATPDVMRLGNAMAKTQEGLVQLNNMDKAKHDITINIDNKTKSGLFGVADKHWSIITNKKTKKVSHTTKSVQITIYEANIQDAIDKFSSGDYEGKGGQQDKLYESLVKKGYTLDEIMSATGGHEAYHATNEKNIEDSYSNTKNNTTFDVESAPNEVETKILQQLLDKNE